MFVLPTFTCTLNLNFEKKALYTFSFETSVNTNPNLYSVGVFWPFADSCIGLRRDAEADP